MTGPCLMGLYAGKVGELNANRLGVSIGSFCSSIEPEIPVVEDARSVGIYQTRCPGKRLGVTILPRLNPDGLAVGVVVPLPHPYPHPVSGGIRNSSRHHLHIRAYASRSTPHADVDSAACLEVYAEQVSIVGRGIVRSDKGDTNAAAGSHNRTLHLENAVRLRSGVPPIGDLVVGIDSCDVHVASCTVSAVSPYGTGNRPGGVEDRVAYSPVSRSDPTEVVLEITELTRRPHA